MGLPQFEHSNVALSAISAAEAILCRKILEAGDNKRASRSIKKPEQTGPN